MNKIFYLVLFCTISLYVFSYEHDFHSRVIEAANWNTKLDSRRIAQRKAAIEECYARGMDINRRNRFGKTPLHEAIERSHWIANELIALLLELGADPNIQDDDGYTSLHVASRGGDAGTLQILLDHGANVDLKNKNGQTPLDIALNHRNHTIAQLLRKESERLAHREEKLERLMDHAATSMDNFA